MTNEAYRISVSGNWCDGYWWSIYRPSTGRTLKEDGPYHKERLSNPREVAWDDAVDWARQNDVRLDNEINPYQERALS